MRALFTFLTIGLLSQIGFAQDFDKVKLDTYFDALEANNKFMGSVAVSKDGEIIYTKTIGYSDVDGTIKANENSKYRIGSISKTFTTVLVFKGIEGKKIILDQTIDKYFPSIQNANEITIGHLLSHRSGIANFTNSSEYLNWYTQPKTEKELVAIISKGGSVFKPDSKADYSNSNFVLLTYILEKTFKKPYADLLTEFITKPIGLKNTYLGGKINPKNNECMSYRYSEKWNTEPETDISIPLGAGGIVSTPADIVKFSNALFSGRLVKQESLDKMKTMKDNYGMGLFTFPFDSKVAYGHTGGIDAFTSVFSYFSDGNISYVLLSNGTNYNNNTISIAVLSAIFGKPYSIPEFRTVDVSAEDLDNYVGVYSSAQFPLKITITKDNDSLFAQATGQSAFPLEATEKDTFKFDRAGIVLEFNPTEKTMLLKQGGGQFNFKKE
jgi:D-alanyl-D-alanine carboxypeptidase